MRGVANATGALLEDGGLWLLMPSLTVQSCATGQWRPLRKKEKVMYDDRLKAAVDLLKVLRSKVHEGMSASELAEIDRAIEELGSAATNSARSEMLIEAALALAGKLFDRLPLIIALIDLLRR